MGALPPYPRWGTELAHPTPRPASLGPPAPPPPPQPPFGGAFPPHPPPLVGGCGAPLGVSAGATRGGHGRCPSAGGGGRRGGRGPVCWGDRREATSPS